MTKSQNTKNEQQNDLCITSEQLTEKWKKGELPSGFYYIKRGLSKRIDMSYLGGALFEGNIEVIELVPTFEEWKASENYIDYLKQCISVYESKDKQATETSIAYNELLEEYQKLKESRAELNSDIVDKVYENAMLKSEYEKECHRADELEDSYWKSEKENKKLKDLLKEIRGKIHYINTPKNRHNIFDKYFVDKIDEVL